MGTNLTLLKDIAMKHKKILGIPVPAAVVALVALAGVAVAAIMLSSAVNTDVSVAETNKDASDDITNVAVIGGEDLSCSNIVVSADGESVSLTALADKTTITAEGGETSLVEDSAGYCTLQATIKNTGDVKLKVDGVSVLNAPAGWTTKQMSGDIWLNPGDTGTFDFAVAADFGAASSGTMTAQINSVVPSTVTP